MIDYFETSKKQTQSYYTSLLDRLNEEIKKKRPNLTKQKKVLFHHDNAPAHTALNVVTKFNELDHEVLPHPAYSPDLAPSDFYLFPNFKRWLQGKKFHSMEMIQNEIDPFFCSLDESYYSIGIKMLENRWTQCIVSKGEYV